VTRSIVTGEELTSSCRAKLDWADKHLDALYRETDGWGDGNPMTVRCESNASGSEHTFFVEFTAQPNVWLWALMLGDALHNLRCALDHTVYALAIAQTRKHPPDDERKLAFPICTEPNLFEGQRYRIASLNEPTQAAIERMQPYNRLKPGEWFSPLWYLSQLNDVDKHRLAHIAASAAVADEIATDAVPGTYQALWNRGYLEDGAPILKLLLDPPNPNVNVDLKATCAVVLQIEGVSPVSVYHMTRRIRREVQVICRYLWRFLGT
jgi:hypothetical protein